MTPAISGKFTNWSAKYMREVLDFCKKCDTDPIDLKSDAIRNGLVRPETKDPNVPLTENEKHYLDNQLENYYRDNWSHVVMKNLKYKNPLVVNSTYLNPQIFNLDSIDVSKHPFVHVSFVKPGKHTYYVSNDHGEIEEEDHK